MTPNSRNTGVAAFLVVMVLAAVPALAAGSSGQTTQSAQLTNVSTQDNLVVVQVSNPGDEPLTVTVTAEVSLANGAVEQGAASVFVNPGDSGTMAMPFSAPVSGVTTLGMSDDVNPF